jgi:hypothetical protein
VDAMRQELLAIYELAVKHNNIMFKIEVSAGLP